MTHRWDEFSKSLAEDSVPRRESLRRLGAAFASAALMPFSLALGASKASGPDPCKTFCKCRNKSQQNQCLAACHACNGKTNRLCGTCGSYACCSGSGLACCGGHCTDLLDNFDHCGACGYACEDPGPYEDGACVDGTCLYQCVQGATRCNGVCTYLGSDINNCGACGHVCPGPYPSCYQGACSNCQPYCPEGWCGGDGCGGECGCPEGFECGETGWCVGGGDPCPAGQLRCNGVCTNIAFDPGNCGACGNVCSGETNACIGGICQSGV